MEKIVYIVKNKLHYYPPCVSQIRMLNDLGYDIEVLYGTSNETVINILNSEGVKCKKIPNISDDNSSLFKKMKIWYNYRKELNKIIKKYDSNIIYWFGTAESVLPMKGKLKGKKYICFVLELLDEYKLKIFLLKEIMQNALAVNVCEQTRAYLQKSWWNLNKIPYVFPNKPYNPIEFGKDFKNEQLIDAFDKIGNTKYILYQGILQNKEELIEIAKALNYTKKHYKFVLMGIDKYKSIEEIKKYYDDLLYIEYIPAPLHLEITKKAHIGIAYYRSDSLNKVFCAPNKIYEYSGFGVPMICNDVPGLTNTVGVTKAAECIELVSGNIKNAIDKIDSNYSEYSKRCIKFFESTDNISTMKKMMNDIKEINKEKK